MDCGEKPNLVDLPEAICEAIASDADLRELLRLWSTLDDSTKRGIALLVGCRNVE